MHKHENMNTVIDFKNDSLEIIKAKQELTKFLIEAADPKYSSHPKIAAYHKRRISELTAIIGK